jgi:hypothetical protein
MIILDLNQVMLSNLMMSLKRLDNNIDENLIRHMVLTSIRFNKQKFGDEYGELIIACDDKNYWRKQYFPYYKANRKKNRDASTLDWNAIFTSLNKIRDELKEYFPYRVIQVESAEADDIIATLCMEYGRDLGGDPILVLSGDKDFVQLQKYSNVTQYDPVRKKFIKSPSPQEYLYEHIIRGDAGDGVPNFLSDDDIFIAEGRQSRITAKRMSEWMKQLLNGKYPSEIFNEGELRNWTRNKKLIDLTQIPEEIESEVLRQYNNQENKTRNKLFNYFIKHKLKNLTEKIGEF